MQRRIIATSDGSKTIYLEELDETYHSTHGAIQEAMHVFIEHGIKLLEGESFRVFEMGFGTGLNALLTMHWADKAGYRVEYHGIEAFPVDREMALLMDYPGNIEVDYADQFKKMHECRWDQKVQITDAFSLKKIHAKLEAFTLETTFYDIVFYDAFGPRAQAGMWELEVLRKMYDGLKPEGVLVTYCAQGQFKRNLKTLGFNVESLPGPPGKREMTLAYKKA